MKRKDSAGFNIYETKVKKKKNTDETKKFRLLQFVGKEVYIYGVFPEEQQTNM